MKKTAFTLIEMVAVLMLVGLLSAVAAVSLAQSQSNLQLEDVIERIGFQDRLVREHARRLNQKSFLEMKLVTGQITGLSGSGVELAGPKLTLPSKWKIERLRTPEVDLISGEANIPCSATGLTPSYAMLLKGPRGEQQWILVLGLSGQVIKVTDENELSKLFEELSQRPDSD